MYETTSDKAAFLADFGTEVTGSASFTAIFDNQFVEYENITGSRPVLTAPYTYPVNSLTEGDALTVDSTSYEVVRVESDGTGWALVILEEQ